jgi:hypothetical protein
MTGLGRVGRCPRSRACGFVLIALLAMLAMGGLYFFMSSISPESLRERAQQKTGDAFAQAREALIGYAVRFRDNQLKQGTAGLVYGYLPIPVIASPGPAVAGQDHGRAAGHSVTEYGAKSHPALESAERHA